MTEATLLVSADSHVIEPVSLWDGLIPDDYWGDATPSNVGERAGGSDPKARIGEMATDTVSAEVLYTSLALPLFTLADAEVQEEAFRRYNDWIIDYCRKAAPERLVGIGLISAYDIDHAVEETRRCHAQGLRGIMIWQQPHPDLRFEGTHYDPLWKTCEQLELPVSLHILTGFGEESWRQGFAAVRAGLPVFRQSIAQRLSMTMDSLTDIVMSGTMDRFPKLQLVMVENEAGWLPFFVDQLDYHWGRRRKDMTPLRLERKPSEYFRDQIHATFFWDPHVAQVVERMGAGNLMWSNDYPHGQSTWPHSREIVNDRLGGLDRASLDQIAFGNACALYHIDPDQVAADPLSS